MDLTSPAFKNNELIPKKYSYRDENLSPPLEITGVPAEAKSLALICDDPDAPVGTWVHWVVWNLDPELSRIEEGEVPAEAVLGKNSWGKAEWGGPAPPSGTHRYVFKLYALKSPVAVKRGASAEDLERAMQGQIIAETQLIGLFSAGR